MEVSTIPEYNLQDILNIAPDFIPTFLGHLRVPASNDNHGQIALKLASLGKLRYPPLKTSLPPLINFTSPNNRFNLIYQLDDILPRFITEEFLSLPRGVQMQVLLQATYRDILSFCKTSTAAFSICDDEEFWKAKFQQDFGNLYPDVNGDIANWRGTYEDHLKKALRDMVYYENQEGIIRVLGIGANIDKQDENGVTALMLASDNGYVDIIELLLANGANVNIQDNNGNTVFLRAALRGQTAIADFWFKRGANINSTNYKGQTALIYAVHNEQIDMIRFLLENGANPNIRDIHGDTALKIATWKEDTDIVNLLKSKGATV